MNVKSTYKAEDREEFLIFLLRHGRFSPCETLKKEDDRSRSNKADGFGKRDFFWYSLFLFLPWQTLSLYPLHRYTMMNYELSTFGLFLSQMRKFLVLSWPGALSIKTKLLVRNSGNIPRQVERFSRHSASLAFSAFLEYFSGKLNWVFVINCVFKDNSFRYVSQ